MAAGMVVGGSVLVVVTVAQQLSTLYSLESREAVAEFLAQPPGSGLGLEVSDALLLLRTTLMVVAGCATAAAVLGVHVLRRSRRARLGLSVLAVPLFLGGMATGGFLTSLVAASVLLLWLGPSRAWLDGRPVPEESPRDHRARSPWSGSSPTAPSAPATPAAPAAQPPPHPTALGVRPPPLAEPGPTRRPDALVWACVITWAFAGLTLVVAAATATLLAAEPGLVWEELQRQNPGLAAESGLDRDSIARATYVTLALTALWALGAVALAVLAYRRSRAGRVGLLSSAAVAAVVSLVGALSSLVMIVPAMACLATVILLARPEVRAWFADAPQRP